MNKDSMTIVEKILTPILERFMGIADIDNYIENSIIKERIETIGRMQIIIYSNDHEPPHFHVKSKDNEINAKFTIKECTYLGGTIGASDLKRVQAFHRDIKTQTVIEMMERVWNKRVNKGDSEQK